MLGSALGAPQSSPNTEGGEAALKLPDLSSVTFLGIDGHKLLLVGLVFCFLGLMFGLGDLHPVKEPARASLDAGNLGADL